MNLPFFSCRAYVPETITVCEFTPCTGMTEGQQQFIVEIVFPQDTQKIYHLLDLNKGLGAVGPVESG